MQDGLDGAPSNAGVKPLGSVRIKPQRRNLPCASLLFDSSDQPSRIAPAANMRSDKHSGQPWRQIWPLVQIVLRQAGGGHGLIIHKQNERSRDCEAHDGCPLSTPQYILEWS